MINIKVVLMCGDRDWINQRTIFLVVKKLVEKYGQVRIIEGGCRGADLISKNAAIYFHQEYKEYPADWDKYKKGAGPIRNQQMLDENPDIDMVIAFHSNIENSRGTKNMIDKAKKKNIKVLIFKE